MCSPKTPKAKEPEQRPLRFLLSRDQFENRANAGGGAVGTQRPPNSRGGPGGSGGLTPGSNLFLNSGGLRQ